MIEIKLNGKPVQLPSEQDVSSFVAELGVPQTGTAIAVNYTLIPRQNYETTILHENDAVEIITAAAGG